MVQRRTCLVGVDYFQVDVAMELSGREGLYLIWIIIFVDSIIAVHSSSIIDKHTYWMTPALSNGTGDQSVIFTSAGLWLIDE